MPFSKPTLPPMPGHVEKVNSKGEHYYSPTSETLRRRETDAKIEQGRAIDESLLGNPNDELQATEQFRKAVQMFAASLDDEKALEIATIYDPWAVGKSYAVGEFVTYGVNGVGDPQLYKVTQDHFSQADWTPDKTASLYDAIGLDEAGYPIWSQPTGAHDAYNTGDIVDYNGVLYISTIDGNVYAPDAYPAGWEAYEG